MILYDLYLDAQLITIVVQHPHNFIKVLNSKGIKPHSSNNQHLINYIYRCTSKMIAISQYHYKLKTLLYWTINHIQDWNDERVKCKVCKSPLYGINVKHIAFGYNRQTCCKECERKLAQQTNKKHLYDKYGVTNIFQLPSTQAKLHNKKDQMQMHRNEAKRKNKTFKISKKEDEAYDLLCKKFGEDDVIRQYYSDVYPFNCDFYIKSLDLYIECNFSWTHGGHWFDENDENDIAQLNKWKEQGTQYYLNAINTWTIRDVKKRNIAKENNLNYIVFWKLDELKHFIDKTT